MSRKSKISEDLEVSINGRKLTEKFKDVLFGEQEDLTQDEREFNFIAAKIKDGICHYTYEVLKGVGIGATHSVKGAGLVRDNLTMALSKLNVHMAAIDDSFSNAQIEIEDIDKEHGHELAGNYHIEGFKIKGSADNERIILIGTKYVRSVGGRSKQETPEVPLDNLSSYKWYNELKSAADEVRRQVERYHGGDYDPIEVVEEEKTKYKQLTIIDGAADEEADKLFAGAEV
jgi:hypothetical protein